MVILILNHILKLLQKSQNLSESAKKYGKLPHAVPCVEVHLLTHCLDDPKGVKLLLRINRNIQLIRTLIYLLSNESDFNFDVIEMRRPSTEREASGGKWRESEILKGETLRATNTVQISKF